MTTANTKNAISPLLTVSEVSTLLGSSRSAVTQLLNKGLLPYQNCGNRKIVQRTALDEYLKSSNLTVAPNDHGRAEASIPAITGLSFFSGAGGLDLGMEKSGIKSLLYVENNRECRMTINANRPEAGLLGDVSLLTAQQVLSAAGLPANATVDVMFGGPPCQSFSTAGARRAFNDARGNVFLAYLDLAARIRPRYLVIENVRGLLSTAYPIKDGGRPVKGGAMAVVLERIERMGYTVSFNLYNAANYGAAQIRERVVIIAKREGKRVHWLQPTNAYDPCWKLPAWRTFNDVVSDIPADSQHYVQFPEKRLRYFKMLQEGQNWTSLPKSVQPEAMGKAYALGGGKTGFYRRLSKSKPSPTLVTSPTMPATDLCHPTEDRPLSVEEYKAIQGFPEEWKIVGNITSMYRQIGNAVPIRLGEAIGKAIVADMQEEPQAELEGFPYSRYKNTSELTWHVEDAQASGC